MDTVYLNGLFSYKSVVEVAGIKSSFLEDELAMMILRSKRIGREPGEEEWIKKLQVSV